MKNVAREATNGVIYGESGEIVKKWLACCLSPLRRNRTLPRSRRKCEYLDRGGNRAAGMYEMP